MPDNIYRNPLSEAEIARRTNRRMAIGFLLAAVVCMGLAFGADQPILALASMIFLVATVLVARHA